MNELPWDEWTEVEQLRYRLAKMETALLLARQSRTRNREARLEAEAEVERLTREANQWHTLFTQADQENARLTIEQSRTVWT